MKSFNLPPQYEESIVRKLKKERLEQDKLKKDLSPFVIHKNKTTYYLPRNFGFCYGVENAISITYEIIKNNPTEKRVFLLSELIHNPQVNEYFVENGIRFLMKNDGTKLIPIESLTPNDIVIIPAFGTTIQMENELKAIGVEIEKYNTTCPFVEKVWKKGAQLNEQQYTIILHGKPEHEETKATFSHVTKNNTPCLVIKDINEAKLLSHYIKKQKNISEFNADFRDRYSASFNPELHLSKLGVINQTTILSYETQEIADYLKNILIEEYKLTQENLNLHFSDTRDTLCYATNENQKAVEFLSKNYPIDIAFVIGGYNSSNTANLYKIIDRYTTSFFIKDESALITNHEIECFNIVTKQYERIFTDKLLQPELKIAIIIGASCPDYMVDNLIKRIQLYR